MAWEAVDVRHKGRALKGWCFCECYIASQVVGKGEGVTQSVPPNLAAELGRWWMFAISGRGLKRAVFGRALRLISSGRKRRRRHAKRAAEPRRVFLKQLIK